MTALVALLLSETFRQNSCDPISVNHIYTGIPTHMHLLLPKYCQSGQKKPTNVFRNRSPDLDPSTGSSWIPCMYSAGFLQGFKTGKNNPSKHVCEGMLFWSLHEKIQGSFHFCCNCLSVFKLSVHSYMVYELCLQGSFNIVDLPQVACEFVCCSSSRYSLVNECVSCTCASYETGIQRVHKSNFKKQNVPISPCICAEFGKNVQLLGLDFLIRQNHVGRLLWFFRSS